MEALTRLVTESLVRHGFDRPLDFRRLHWSRWFRCESHHSLLSVPSKPGVFAVAEEVVPLRGTSEPHGRHPEQNEGSPEARRMLAVTQFFESEDMAFSLDRMLVQANPMRTRLNSGRYFIRYVAIADESQRRSIATALNQWIVNAGEKSGIGSHFASSLELTESHVGTDCVGTGTPARPAERSSAAPHLDSGSATNIHCPSPLPSGF
jgi:hypothetical protein